MYQTQIRHSTRLERLMCQWFGHQMTEGLKYRSATKRGCSTVCHRCGFYELSEHSLDNPAPSVSNSKNPISSS